MSYVGSKTRRLNPRNEGIYVKTLRFYEIWDVDKCIVEKWNEETSIFLRDTNTYLIVRNTHFHQTKNNQP